VRRRGANRWVHLEDIEVDALGSTMRAIRMKIQGLWRFVPRAVVANHGTTKAVVAEWWAKKEQIV
jgi:hypothetical protein